MSILRVAALATALISCAIGGPVTASMIEAQYRAPAEQAAPAELKAPAAEREPRVKERTPPPRPIVPPEGQQQNPALREDCAWIGQRIVSLLVRDDPMTGNDFVPFYQRFNCPQEHLSKAFGCVVAAGSGENDVLAERVAQCWTDPAQRPGVASETDKKPTEAVPTTGKPSNGSK
jgi:hypothetical protein